jgi:hypothetical protein
VRASPPLGQILPEIEPALSTTGEVPPDQTKPGTAGLYTVLKFALILGLFFLLGYLFLRDLQRLPNIRLSPSYTLLALSFAILIIGLLLEVWVWKKNLQAVGAGISLKNSFKLYYQANLARYIPGKIWSILGFIKLGQSARISPVRTVSALITGLFASLISAFLLGGVFFLLSGNGKAFLSPWITIPLLVLSLASLHPSVSAFFVLQFSRITRRPLESPSYKFRHTLSLVALYASAWLVFSFSFVLLTSAFESLTAPELIYVWGVLPISYALGYLAFFTPGGWGVREGGIVLLLNPILPTYLAVTIAIISRLMFTLIEGIFFALALRMKWNHG